MFQLEAAEKKSERENKWEGERAEGEGRVLDFEDHDNFSCLLKDSGTPQFPPKTKTCISG